MPHLPKSILDCMDKSYHLVYVDRGDGLNAGQMPEALKAIKAQDYSPLDESICEFVWDSEEYGLKYAMDELKNEIASSFDCDEDRAQDFIDRHYDLLRDEIQDRDTSSPLGDLLRNTGDVIFTYDLETGVDGYGAEDDELRNVKRALKIAARDKSYDGRLRELIANASYGGNLVVFFAANIEDMLEIGTANVVTFSDPYIAIVDYLNGSGHDVQLKGLTLRVKYSPDNLDMDLLHKYNYTNAVCGMVSGWCNGTDFEFKTDHRTK